MTAVEFLIKQVGLDHTDVWKKEIEQALEMEKQQKEKMYSEEEVLDLLAGFADSQGKDFIPFKDIQEWFEQFKKETYKPSA
jgi:hypothetical protein